MSRRKEAHEKKLKRSTTPYSPPVGWVPGCQCDTCKTIAENGAPYTRKVDAVMLTAFTAAAVDFMAVQGRRIPTDGEYASATVESGEPVPRAVQEVQHLHREAAIYLVRAATRLMHGIKGAEELIRAAHQQESANCDTALEQQLQSAATEDAQDFLRRAVEDVAKKP